MQESHCLDGNKLEITTKSIINKLGVIELIKIILYICKNELISASSTTWMNIRSSTESRRQMIPFLWHPQNLKNSVHSSNTKLLGKEAHGCLNQLSIQLRLSAQIMISEHEVETHGSLHAQLRVYLRFFLPLSDPTDPLSKMNK